MTTRADCLRCDDDDELAPLRDLFDLPADVVYLDGNSLGALPRAAAARMQQVVADEWGRGLIRSWNSAGWIDLAQRIGNKIARLVGAGDRRADRRRLDVGQSLQGAACGARPRAHGRARAHRHRVRAAQFSDRPLYRRQRRARARRGVAAGRRRCHRVARSTTTVAVLLLTHVNYRTGRMHRMDAINRAAHAAGALVVWDLSHSAGAVPVALNGNGRPRGGGLRGRLRLQVPEWRTGCARVSSGRTRGTRRAWTRGRLAAAAVGVARSRGALRLRRGLPSRPRHRALHLRHAPGALARGARMRRRHRARRRGVGGIAALRRKSLALTDLFIALVEARCGGHGLALQTPRDPCRCAAAR